MIVEIKIMQDAQTHTEHLLRLEQVANICPAVMAAGRTLASLLDRTVIQLIFGIKEVQLAVLCIDMSVTAVSGRINAVKEIHATVDGLQNIQRCADAHQIDRLLLRKIRNDLIQNMIHLLMCLTDCKSADCVAIQIHLPDLLCVLNTDIRINRTLIDSEQQLMRVHRILKAVQPCHLRLAARQPACRALDRPLDICAVRHA